MRIEYLPCADATRASYPIIEEISMRTTLSRSIDRCACTVRPMGMSAIPAATTSRNAHEEYRHEIIVYCPCFIFSTNRRGCLHRHNLRRERPCGRGVRARCRCRRDDAHHVAECDQFTTRHARTQMVPKMPSELGEAMDQQPTRIRSKLTAQVGERREYNPRHHPDLHSRSKLFGDILSNDVRSRPMRIRQRCRAVLQFAIRLHLVSGDIHAMLKNGRSFKTFFAAKDIA